MSVKARMDLTICYHVMSLDPYMAAEGMDGKY